MNNIPIRKSDTISTIYTEQFEEYLKKAKEDGLQYINLYYADGNNKNNVKYEDFCEEFINMKNSPTLSDEEVLGKYSI
jgi:hypothetical protein